MACMRRHFSDSSVLQVDVDLSPEQFAAKVSRQQARLYLKSDGVFRLTNTGRRKFLVNNTQVCSTHVHCIPTTVPCT